MSDSDVGSTVRPDNALERMEVHRDDDRREADELERRLGGSKAELNRPFEQEQELTVALSELSELTAKLDIHRSADDGALLDDGELQQEEPENLLELDEDDEDEPEM